MANALVIRNADFSEYAIDTVQFTDVPCTGLTLNKSSASISQFGGTETLVAFKTPLDTTDSVSWHTSDADIATVTNGVVTAVGIGTAIIKAVCGYVYAACVVTTAAYFDPAFEYQTRIFSATAPNGSRYVNVSAHNPCVALCGRSGSYKARINQETTVEADCYPIVLPKNVKSIHVHAADCYIGVSWSNTTYTELADYAVGLGGNAAGSTANVHDDVWYDVPAGVDSVSFTIRNMDGTDMTAEVLANIDWSVTYSTESAPND